MSFGIKLGKTQSPTGLLWLLFFIFILCIISRQYWKSARPSAPALISVIADPLKEFHQTVFGMEKTSNGSIPSYASIEQGGSLEGWVRGWMATPEFREQEGCAVEESSQTPAFSKSWQTVLWNRLQWLKSRGFQPSWNSYSKTHLDRSFQVLYPTGEESAVVAPIEKELRDLNEAEFSRQLQRCSFNTHRRFWIEAIYAVPDAPLELERLILENPPASLCPQNQVEAINGQIKTEVSQSHSDQVSFLLIWQFFCHYPEQTPANPHPEGKSR